jgi:hypothetical protein
MIEVIKNTYVTTWQHTFLKNALFSSNSDPHIRAGIVLPCFLIPLLKIDCINAVDDELRCSDIGSFHRLISHEGP